MREIKIIHHNDLDGFMGANVIRAKIATKVSGLSAKVKYFCCSHDKKDVDMPKRETFNQNGKDIVLMVDYSVDAEMMKWLRDNTEFYWIDHHKSSIEDSVKMGYDDTKGLRKIGLCGAELAWMFSFKNKQLPAFLKMVGDYDTFRSFENKEHHQDKVVPFSLGSVVCMNNLNPENYGADDFYFNDLMDLEESDYLIDKFIDAGKIVYKYKEMFGRTENSDITYVRKIWGYNVLCLNSSNTGSLDLTIPATFDTNIHDMMCVYSYNGSKWCYGLYTDKEGIDVGKICSSYGGGGHLKAGGCVMEKLLPELL